MKCPVCYSKRFIISFGSTKITITQKAMTELVITEKQVLTEVSYLYELKMLAIIIILFNVLERNCYCIIVDKR